MQNINWGNLVEKGRAKGHGIPWSDEEWAAIQAVSGAEKTQLIADLRAGKVPEPKVGESEPVENKVFVSEGTGEEPVAKPKPVKKPVKKTKK